VDAAAETPATAPAPGAPDWLRWADRLPFIPVPLIDTSPNGGLKIGLFPIMLSSNERGETDRILAPDVIHSQYFGWGARWRTFRYPSADHKWSVVAGGKEHAEREFDFEDDAGLLRDDDWSRVFHAMYDRTATNRFYGLGNHSPLASETSYVDNQARIEVGLGRNFNHALQLAYGARLINVEIEPSVLPRVRSVETLFPGLPGVGDEHEFQQRLELAWDSRDAAEIPHTGERFVAYAGFSQRGLLSSSSYTFWGLDASVFRRIAPGVVFAGHAAVRLMPSAEYVPFWALSSVGGDRAVMGGAQPLRGYASGRFVDRNSFSTTIEIRREVAVMHLFATDLSLELDPFLDMGKVYRHAIQNPFNDNHRSAGLGFRVLASPFVVGYLDIGFAGNHTAVFTGIDYPF
jgi:outer membrane protein assembly factor BamA